MNNDNRIRIRVMGLSTKQVQEGVYALILQQTDGPIHIPMIIGATEAQAIAMQMEKVAPPRPLTHDLFAGFARSFGIELVEVYINRFDDGIFSAEMTLTDGSREVVLDCRASDAVALAMRFRAPMYMERSIMEETGFVVEHRENFFQEQPVDEFDTDIPDLSPEQPDNDDYENMTTEELLSKLESYTEAELYEQAARVSEIIKQRKSQQ